MVIKFGCLKGFLWKSIVSNRKCFFFVLELYEWVSLIIEIFVYGFVVYLF